MNLPDWITVDSANSQLVGMAGSFAASTKAAANAAAQSAIVAFGDTAIATGNLACVSPTPPVTCPDWPNLLWDTATVFSSSDFGGQGTATFSPISTTSDNFSLTGVDTGPNPFNGGCNAFNFGTPATLIYNGAGCDCNLRLEVTSNTNPGFHSDTILVNISWYKTVGMVFVGQLNVDDNTLVPGVYNYPFTIPDATTDQLTIFVQVELDLDPFNTITDPMALAFNGLITNVP